MAAPSLDGAAERPSHWGWVWPVAAHLALVAAALAVTLLLVGDFAASGWQQAVSHWDSHWYLAIAQSGYPTQVGPEWAFFPLLPGLVAAVIHLGLRGVEAGLLISLLATALLAYCLDRLGAIEVGPSRSLWVPWLLLMSPFGFFFFAIYTEALFYALVAAAFLSARRGNFMLAGLAGALAAATRVNGIFLVVALLLEALQQAGWSWRRLPRQALWVLAVPCGTLGFALFSWLRTGSWLAVVKAESDFGIHAAWPWSGFWTTWNSVNGGENVWRAVFLPELIAGLLGIPILLLAAWKLRPLYSSFMILSWLAAVSLNFWRSVPRYEFAFFPLLFLVVLATERARWLRWVLLVVGAVTMAFGASVFARGLWLD